MLALGFSFLLSRFRKEVERTLESGSSLAVAASVRVCAPYAALEMRELQAAPCGDVQRRVRRQLQIQLCFYVIAVLVSAVLLLEAALIHERHTLPEWLVMQAGALWPLGPMLAVFLRVRRRTVFLGAGAFLAALGLVAWLFQPVFGFMAFHAVLGVLLMPLLVGRARRAMTWKILALGVALIAGLRLDYLYLHGAPQWLTEFMIRAADRPPFLTRVLALVLPGALAALVLWRAAPWFFRLLGALRLNDRLLALGSYWLSYCAISGAGAIDFREDSSEWWMEASIAGSSVLPLAAALWAGAWLAKRACPAPSREPRLLYLRSFRSEKGTELFEWLRDMLLNVSSIDLIAGPDLAPVLASTQELVEFVGRGSGRKYLHDLASFEARRAEVDGRMDIEGRHRIHEYYCGNEIWTRVFRRLAQDADVVLIDVRGLQSPKDGVAYELQELIRWVPLKRVIVVTDRSRPAGLLDLLAQAAWQSLPANSPSTHVRHPSIALFELDPERPSESQRLLGHVCAILEKPRVRAPAPRSPALAPVLRWSSASRP